MITNVLMDVDNTLLDFNKCAEEAIKIGFSKWNIAYNASVFPVFLEVNDSLWRKIETGEMDKKTLYQLRWKTIFERLGIHADGPAFEQDFRTIFSDSKEPVDGAYEILAYLTEKYTVSVASNASYQQQLKRLSNADMLKYFTHIFNSEQIGHPKPEPKFFDACFEKLGNIPKEEVIIIGDSLSADINGGAAYGIKTLWFNYGKAEIPNNVNADFIVNSLDEIKNIL